VVDVDAIRLDAEGGERVALGGEVLGVGGDAGVADLEFGRAPERVPFAGRSPVQVTEPPLRHTVRRFGAMFLLRATGVPVGVPASDVLTRIIGARRASTGVDDLGGCRCPAGQIEVIRSCCGRG
jgi:hypothetical protein